MFWRSAGRLFHACAIWQARFTAPDSDIDANEFQKLIDCSFLHVPKQELSYRKQIARQLHKH